MGLDMGQRKAVTGDGAGVPTAVEKGEGSDLGYDDVFSLDVRMERDRAAPAGAKR